jgi:hypothetical protein
LIKRFGAQSTRVKWGEIRFTLFYEAPSTPTPEAKHPGGQNARRQPCPRGDRKANIPETKKVLQQAAETKRLGKGQRMFSRGAAFAEGFAYTVLSFNSSQPSGPLKRKAKDSF